jgi:hypothetical protein
MARRAQDRPTAGMSGFRKLFLDHPNSLGMSWAEHGAGAVKVGFALIGAGLAALVHAVVPAIFGETASRTVIRTYEHIQRTRSPSDDRD